MPDCDLFELARQDGISVVTLVNPELMNRLMVTELGDALISFVEAEEPEKLLVDFKNVTYCSSEVIGSLIRTWKRVTPGGGVMKLCGMNNGIRDLFRLTRLDQGLFEIYDTTATAIEHFQQTE